MTRTLLASVAILGALALPASAETSSTPTPNDIASWQAMNAAPTAIDFNSASAAGKVVIVNTAEFNDTPNYVESMNAMIAKGRALTPSVQATIDANPGLAERILSAKPGLDLSTVYAINVAPDGNVYLYTS